MYSVLCVVKGDTTELCKSLGPLVEAAQYYEIIFEVVLSLGLTELKAYICWDENVSSHRLDKFWLSTILLTTINRALREGMKYCRLLMV